MDLKLYRKLAVYTTICVSIYTFGIALNKFDLNVKFNSELLTTLFPIIISIVLLEVTYSIGKLQTNLQKRDLKMQLYHYRMKVYIAFSRLLTDCTCGRYTLLEYITEWRQNPNAGFITFDKLYDEFRGQIYCVPTLFENDIENDLEKVLGYIALVNVSLVTLDMTLKSIESTYREEILMSIMNNLIPSSTPIDLPKDVYDCLQSCKDALTNANDYIVKSDILIRMRSNVDLKNIDL